MNLPLIPGTLPYNCYPPNPQTLVNDAFELGVAQLTSSLTGVIVSDTQPSAADRDKVWFRTSAGAPVFPSLWLFFLGQWLAKHPVPAGSLWALPYTGPVAGIATLDGGAAGAINPDGTTGPFWEEVVSLRARMPIGAGTLPSGLVLAVGDAGGEEKHLLSGLESGVGAHKHSISSIRWSNTHGFTDSGGGGPGTTGAFTPDTDDAAPVAATDAHNNLSPFFVLTFLKRTNRTYCTQPLA
jgi:hypothetical protein